MITSTSCTRSRGQLGRFWLLVFLMASLASHLDARPRSTYYDGTATAFVVAGDEPAHDPSLDLTIEAWVYREETGRCETIVSRNYLRSYWFGFCQGGRLRFYRSGATEATGLNVITANKWTHVGVTYDGTTARFFIDGNLDATRPLGNDGWGHAGDLYIGWDPNGNNLPFHGYMDELRIWTGAKAWIGADRFREVASTAGNLAVSFPHGGREPDTPGGATGRGTETASFGVLPRDLEVPRVAAGASVTLDGEISLADEYLGAEHIPLRYDHSLNSSTTPDAHVRLVHDEEYLYVGITFIADPAPTARESSAVQIYLDPNLSRDGTPTSGDHALTAWLDPARGASWFGGTGSGYQECFISISPTLEVPCLVFDPVFEVAYGSFCSGEFTPPCQEFRIKKSLLGEWTETDGFAIGHIGYRQSGLRFAPVEAHGLQPSTWARMSYLDSSDSSLPRAHFEGRVYDNRLGSADGLQGIGVQVRNGITLEPLREEPYRTIPDGIFNFSLPVPVGVPLIIELVDLCDGCRLIEWSTGGIGTPPEVRSGVGPNSTIRYPACEVAPGEVCVYQPIEYAVQRAPQGLASIASTEPNPADGHVLLREDPERILEATETVELHGENLHEFMDIYMYRRNSCFSFPPEPACDSYRVEIEEIARNGRSARVRLPHLAGQLALNSSWDWVIHDRWERFVDVDGDGSDDWRAWTRFGAAPFRVQPPEYPLVWGLGFENQDDVSSALEFEGVYGDNAFLVCHLPNPIYWIVFFPIYKIILDNGDGSCFGMAGTSALMFQDALRANQFDPLVHFPAGFTDAGRPDRYDVGFCDYASPENIWAQVRIIHGIQTSDENLNHVFQQMRGGIPDLGGDPRAVLARVESNAPGPTIICMFPGGTGHCVVGYGVEPVDAFVSKIKVYDNNFPGDTSREIFIDTRTNTYRFPRNAAKDNEWVGTGIYTVGTRILKGERSMPGLEDGARLLWIVVVGSANPEATDDRGRRWGWDEAGEFRDEIPGVIGIPTLGPSERDTRNVPLLVPREQEAPHVTVRSRGGDYFFHTALDGVIIQLEAQEAVAGQADEVELVREGESLAGFEFVPQRSGTAYLPRVGLRSEEDEAIVFKWIGLDAPAGGRIALRGRKSERSAELQNFSGETLSYHLAIETGDDTSESLQSHLYGPFSVPDGAVHRLALDDWPLNRDVYSGIDLDGDGRFDNEVHIPRFSCDIDDRKTLTDDCDRDGVVDTCAILAGFAPDNNANGIPDTCEFLDPPVLPPRDVQAFLPNAARAEVLLTWGENPVNPPLGGYNVYRRDGDGGGFRRVNDEPIADTKLFDASLEFGVRYCYVVRAVSINGLESVDSNSSCIDTADVDPTEVRFLRGDCNDDDEVDISDPLCLLGWLFLGEDEPGCVAAANANSDKLLDISDPLYLLTYLFLGTQPPAAPFPNCGVSPDPVDAELGCRIVPPGCR